MANPNFPLVPVQPNMQNPPSLVQTIHILNRANCNWQEHANRIARERDDALHAYRKEQAKSAEAIHGWQMEQIRSVEGGKRLETLQILTTVQRELINRLESEVNQASQHNVHAGDVLSMDPHPSLTLPPISQETFSCGINLIPRDEPTGSPKRKKALDSERSSKRNRPEELHLSEGANQPSG
ncbi:hypothetical protein EDB81DRAFT_761621 [Dactylonectria macrodidyma]|uniref:Uncharacterized protein n=1 Tax=Dactylonectria macrodidyma TaxID=307937 RepID=A0A9P9IZ65_9HYPO|nr:hypothetical protein EDB81DRAFT_761621 [Dactylonectria macrodidyma]